MGDKVRNKAKKLKGKAKEKVGQATGNQQLQTEGRVDQAKADVSQVGEKMKDVYRRS
jgi:uncharacterized protein YjbJ (UPF0337 family)